MPSVADPVAVHARRFASRQHSSGVPRRQDPQRRRIRHEHRDRALAAKLGMRPIVLCGHPVGEKTNELFKHEWRPRSPQPAARATGPPL